MDRVTSLDPGSQRILLQHIRIQHGFRLPSPTNYNRKKTVIIFTSLLDVVVLIFKIKI